MELILNSIRILFQPGMLLCMIAGVTAGLIAGALPGISATMAMALFTPLTYGMDKSVAFGVLCAIYVGGISGGLYSAVLLNIPGTNASIATTFDGFPLARQGKASQAIGVALVSSFIGSTIGFVFLSVFSPILAEFALEFGPAEYFAVSILGLSTIASLVGESTVKGIISALFGLCLSTVGIDGMSGSLRFTFGSPYLTGGVTFIAVLIGYFAIPQILNDLADPRQIFIESDTSIKSMIPNFKELFKHWANFLRSSLIGVWIGVLPVAGSTTAALIAYDQAKKASKHPEKFGKGAIDGIIAPETANNAVIGGAYIPMLTLGIPGDSPAAIMLAALTIHGLQAGPLLFKTNPGDINLILMSLWVSAIIMIIVAFVGAKYIIRSLMVPKSILLPVIIVMCSVGSFAINQSWFDVFLMFCVGFFAYFMGKYRFPTGPAVLGLILGPLVEINLRRAIQVSNTGIIGIINRPLTAILLIATAINFVFPFVRPKLKAYLNKRKSVVANTSEETDIKTTSEQLSSEDENKRLLMRKANRNIGLGLIAFAGIYYWSANMIQNISQHGGNTIAFDPSFFPKIIAICMAIFGAILITIKVPLGEEIAPGFSDKKRAFLQILLIVCYPVCMMKIGFVVSTIIFLFISMIYIGKMEKREYSKAALISLATTTVIFVLIEKMFVVILPHGIIF